jgi:hypothetical protein
MSKVVLIIDEPEKCTECIAYHLSTCGRICQATKKKIDTRTGRPRWCPLKEKQSETTEI